MRYARYALTAALLAAPALAGAQTKPTNDAPNPFNTVTDYFKLPAGRTWGSTSAVEIDKDGRSIWVAERCGLNSCLDRAAGKMSDLPTILKFDASGKLVTSFGAGLLVFPHGIYVDKDGNIWVTDGQDNAPQPARGPRRPRPAAASAGRAAAARVHCPAPRSAIRSTSSARTARCC
jgi:streptogramin lyase